MQHSNKQATLTAADRQKLMLAALADGEDATKLSDADLVDTYGAQVGINPAGAGGQGSEPSAAGGAQGSGDGDQSGDAGDGDQSGDAGDGGAGSDVGDLPEPPPLTGKDPMEDHIRRIAREEDAWQNENIVKPIVTDTRAMAAQAQHQANQAAQAAEAAARAASDAFEQAQAAAQAGQPPAPVQVNVTDPAGAVKHSVTIEHAHPYLELCVRAIKAGVNLMLVGPAGSGKTTLAHQVAESLGLDFYFTGAIQMEYKLTGFVDANGVFQDTQFYEAFTKGGLFLFDEKDASSAQAILAFNAALANGWADFPNGKAEKHPDFIVMAACNTYGRAADRQYVGRNQQDAAALDRYAVIDLNYDEANESAWACAALGIEPEYGSFNPVRAIEAPSFIEDRQLSAEDVNIWVERVQAIRASVERHSIRHVVSPRASIMGAKLLAAGFPGNVVEDMVIWKGLDRGQVQKVTSTLAAAA